MCAPTFFLSSAMPAFFAASSTVRRMLRSVLHLCGLKIPPFQLAIKGDRLAIRGTWQGFPKIAGHPGFTDLAAMLGQDHTGPTKFVPVAGLDPDVLWEAAERAARAINS